MWKLHSEEHSQREETQMIKPYNYNKNQPLGNLNNILIGQSSVFNYICTNQDSDTLKL